MQAMLSGHYLAQCLHVAAMLGLSDLIEQGRSTVEELAAATQCHQHSLQRMVRALASVGVFTEDAVGQLSLTPLGATLRSNAPESVRDMAIFISASPLWRAWDLLHQSVKTGEPSFPQLHGTSVYQYLADHAELGAIFNRFMTSQSKLHNDAIVEAYDFSGVQTLVDVGGGHGATLSAVLDRYPSMKGILFDLPEVVTTAAPQPADRCQVIGGDMLESVPAGGNVYIIKRVLMDRTSSEAVTVLGNCVSAMRSGGKVLVIDPMLPDGNTPHANWLVDMNMLVNHGGGCRTQAQFRTLFESAGLDMTRVVATRSPNFILEGVKR
jgi:hypothetical protein